MDKRNSLQANIHDKIRTRVQLENQAVNPEPPLYQSATFIRVYLREPLEPGSSARGGGKFRLPQRPEVSSKQATPLPLPNRLWQPLDYLREPLDPGSSLLKETSTNYTNYPD